MKCYEDDAAERCIHGGVGGGGAMGDEDEGREGVHLRVWRGEDAKVWREEGGWEGE